MGTCASGKATESRCAPPFNDPNLSRCVAMVCGIQKCHITCSWNPKMHRLRYLSKSVRRTVLAIVSLPDRRQPQLLGYNCAVPPPQTRSNSVESPPSTHVPALWPTPSRAPQKRMAFNPKLTGGTSDTVSSSSCDVLEDVPRTREPSVSQPLRPMRVSTVRALSALPDPGLISFRGRGLICRQIPRNSA
jgi:hypothetical protein